MLLLLLIFGFTAILVALLLSVKTDRVDPVEARLRELETRRTRPATGAAETVAEAPGPQQGRLKEILGKVDSRMQGSQANRRLQEKLRRAGLRVLPAEFTSFQAASALGGVALSLLLLGGALWPLFGVLGFMAPHIWLSRRADKRSKQLEQQLPDALALMANSLRSGFSFLQAMDVVAKEMPEPINREFSQVLRENRVGIALEEALTTMARRVGSQDLDLAVTAVLIQRQVGGNLAEVLDKIAETIKDRIKLLGQVRTLTTQGRMSGWIIGALPAVLAVVFYLINPGYMGPMFTHPAGWFMLAIAGMMEFIGMMVIRKMVHLEV